MSFETDHLLVPPGQDSGGDENAADVLDDLAFRDVQGFVREGRRPEPRPDRTVETMPLESQRIAVTARSVSAKAS